MIRRNAAAWAAFPVRVADSRRMVMTRTKPPAEDAEAAIRRGDGQEDARQERHEGDATAATRLDMPKARIGAELAGEKRADRSSETADAIKRAAENDQRV